FAFHPGELRRVLPERIVQAMVQTAPPEKDPVLLAALNKEGLLRLPASDDLPVAFIARLSLSFPLLVSAVPLWTRDYTLRRNQASKPDYAPFFERCWFSDGGIGSNFPVHFFDSGFPRWPTFAINLRPFHPEHPRNPTNEANNVWRPRTNKEGIT